MANITLPSNPVNGQTVTIGTRLFEYNSTTQRWSSRVFQVLGDTSVTVTNQAPTITASLSEVALDTTGANVLFTYTVSDVDSSALKVSHEVNGVTNSTYATVYHHKANNTVTVQAGTANFSSANVVLTVTDGRNNASVSIDVSAAYASWDINNATYSQFYDPANNNLPYGCAISSDGTALYVTNHDNDRVYQYTLSTAYDTSTASLYGAGAAYTNSNPYDMHFSPDGTRLYYIDSNYDRVRQFTLSTAWDITTASYVNELNIQTQDANPRGIALSSDGTKLYTVGQNNDQVDEWDLSTAWDITTATENSNNLATGLSIPGGIQFKPDGTKMFIINNGSPYTVKQWNLSTAWDISTADSGATTIDYFTETNAGGVAELAMTGLCISEDGFHMYTVGYNKDYVYEWDLT